MATIQYEVPNNVQRMTIGVQGENNVREFLFDVTEWRQITGNIGAAEMVVQRNGDASPYAAAITMHDENTVSWVPTSTDTEKVGAGKLQLMWIASGQTVKTKIFDMKVDESLEYAVPDTSLDPWASWMPDIINADANYKGLANRVDNIQKSLTSPYNFKGSCTFANLPVTAEVNDTWYLTDRKYRVTWTGSAWQQSSMDESDYEDELADVKRAADGASDKIHDFAVPAANLFDVSAAVEGYALSTTDGVPFEAPLYTASDFMPVEAGSVYKYQQFQSGDSGLFLILYDGDRAFVKREMAIAGFTVPDGVMYARLSIKTEYVGAVMFSKATSAPNGIYYPFEMRVDGGRIVPQSVSTDALSKEGVTADKTSFLTAEGNLFPSETILQGYALDSITGFPFAVEGYYTSDFIPVVPGAVYCLSAKPYMVTQYDLRQEFVGRAYPDATYQTFAAGDEAEYIRICFADSVSAETVILNRGKWLTSPPDRRRSVLSGDIKVQSESVRDVIFKASTNLFDVGSIISDRYLLGTGVLMAADGYYSTDFIACEPGTTYNIYPSGTERIVFYDADKAVLSAQTGVYNDFDTPANAAYFRFTNSLTRTQIARVQVTKGSGVRRHEAFDEYGIAPKRRRITSLSEVWWRWKNGEKCPIGFMGDSTTDGAGTTHGATHEPEDNDAGGFGRVDYINPDAYPYLVEKMCREELGNDQLRVYNIGYSGTYYDWAIPKYDDIFGGVYADVKMVGLVYGINDRTVYTTPYDYFTVFRNNLLYTINYLYDRGIQPFLVTTQATVEPSTRTDMPDMPLRSSLFIKSVADDVIHSVAQEYDLELIDMNRFDEYVLSCGEQPVSVIVPDTLHFSDYGNRLEAGFLFSRLNLRTVDITGSCTLSFTTQSCRSAVPSNVLTKTRRNGFNCSVQYARQGDTTSIVLQDFWVSNLTGGKVRVTACCPEVLGQSVVIDGVETAVSAADQVVAELDVGVHHIAAMSGTTEKLSWYGFKVEVV